MWGWTRSEMTGTSRTERETNEAVVNEVDEVDEKRTTMVNSTRERKIKPIGHLLGHDEFVAIVVEGKISGKGTGGRPREFFSGAIEERSSGGRGMNNNGELDEGKKIKAYWTSTDQR